MNSIVCLKEVPDTETRIEVRDGQIAEEGVQYVVNPYDEFALEEALNWQEAHGGKVTLVSLGPERARESILKGLAMGADEVYHLSDEHSWGAMPMPRPRRWRQPSPSWATMTPSFAASRPWTMTTPAVGIMLAELLDLPHVSVVSSLEIDARTASRPGPSGTSKAARKWSRCRCRRSSLPRRA